MREREQRDEEQQSRDAEEGPRPLAPPMVIGACEYDREEPADHGADGLSQRDAGADLAARGRDQARGAVDGRESEDDQDRGDDEQQSPFPGHCASTSRRNVAPRSS